MALSWPWIGVWVALAVQSWPWIGDLVALASPSWPWIGVLGAMAAGDDFFGRHGSWCKFSALTEIYISITKLLDVLSSVHSRALLGDQPSDMGCLAGSIWLPRVPWLALAGSIWLARVPWLCLLYTSPSPRDRG